MSTKHKSFYILLLALAVFIVSWVVWGWPGGFGLIGDDWRSVWPAFWADLPESVAVFMVNAKRIFQSIHVLGLFEIFGFRVSVYNLSSMLLHLAGVAAMSKSMRLSFPNQKRAIDFAVVFGCFMPLLTILLFRIAYDGMRLSIVLFWLGAICYQRFFQRRSLVLYISAIIILGATFLTYENTSLSAPIVWLLGLVIEQRTRPNLRRSLMVVTGTVAVGYALSYAMLFGVRSLLNLPFHSPIQTLQLGHAVGTLVNGVSLLLPSLTDYVDVPLLLIAGVIAGLIIWCLRSQEESVKERFLTYRLDGDIYLLILGVVIYIAGTFPYILANYTFTPIHSGSNRVYGFAAHGLALILGILCKHVSKPRLKTGLQLIIGAWVFFSILCVFQRGVSQRNFEQQQQSVYQQWMTLVPDVKPDTVFLLVDFQYPVGPAYSARFAQVMYDDPSVRAYYLYSARDGVALTDENYTDGEIARVASYGVLAQYSVYWLPLDNLIILSYRDGKVELRDQITRDDNMAIEWRDQGSISTHFERIVTDTDNVENLKRLGFLRD